jgi:hypothetical protein
MSMELETEYVKNIFLLHRFAFPQIYYSYYYCFLFFYVREELITEEQILSTLNMSIITSEFRTVMFVIGNLQTTFHIKYVDIFMINIHIK